MARKCLDHVGVVAVQHHSAVSDLASFDQSSPQNPSSAEGSKRISELNLKDNLSTNKRALNDFDKVFKVIGAYKFDEKREYRISVRDEEGCALLEFSELNVTARLCQLELVFFLHSKLSWEGDVTFESPRFDSDLSWFNKTSYFLRKRGAR